MLPLDGPIILEAVTGSKAYGMDTEDSDTDTIGIYIAPISSLIGIRELSRADKTRVHPDRDSVYHELGKFCRLALGCNPTLLELLWIPEEELLIETDIAALLRDIRESFLSRQTIRNSYGGYALSQAKRLTRRGEDHPRYAKHGRHCFRLMLQGMQLLETGQMTVRLTPEQRERIFALGELSPDQLMEEFDTADAAMAHAATVSSLPDEPDTDGVNEFLLTARWYHHGTGET